VEIVLKETYWMKLTQLSAGDEYSLSIQILTFILVQVSNFLTLVDLLFICIFVGRGTSGVWDEPISVTAIFFFTSLPINISNNRYRIPVRLNNHSTFVKYDPSCIYYWLWTTHRAFNIFVSVFSSCKPTFESVFKILLQFLEERTKLWLWTTFFIIATLFTRVTVFEKRGKEDFINGQAKHNGIVYCRDQSAPHSKRLFPWYNKNESTSELSGLRTWEYNSTHGISPETMRTVLTQCEIRDYSVSGQ